MVFEGETMRRHTSLSFFAPTLVTVLMASHMSLQAQTAAAKQISKDEVYFSIARQTNSITESPVSAIVAEVDGVIEVVEIKGEADGKSLVTVKERTPSSAAYTNKSTRLKFAPPSSGSQWTWVEFEENRKFYPVEKIFPYVKDELGKRRKLIDTKWSVLLASINKQGESANKVLETAKSVIKADPPPLATLTNARNNLNQAVKDNAKEGIIDAYRELAQQSEPINALGETYPDLKANDAYLRLLEEYKNSINMTAAARKDYVQTVEAYNETLLRLPFALVAYGLHFSKIESNISAE
jgi:LemA protein